MDVDVTDQKLISILSKEIHRDGGASLVRNLKDYTCIDSLLKKSSSPKLLAFLENHPAIFEVHRDMDPHVVYLISEDECLEDAAYASSVQTAEDCKEILLDRIVCLLKKEASKDARRKKDNSAPGVNILWLLKKCKNQFHRYLRLSGYYQIIYSTYREVKLVGSNEWNNAVLNKFISIAEDVCVPDGNRIHLKDENEGDTVDIQALASILTRKVEEDGGTHINLVLLLHRYPELRKFLGGHDLIELKADHEEYFKDLNIFVRNNQQVYIQSKKTKEGRMEVDETGLFSVTSARWGNAFATMMANKCRSILSQEPRYTVAIDLTASVGGITLPFAKIFSKVIAVEIDARRADMCLRNMTRYEVAQCVDIRNEDSIAIIPDLAKELAGHSSIIVVDPPWGGMHHKEEDKPIMMGKWTMIQVMDRITKHFSPTVVGLRMPVNFKSDEFFQHLEEAGVVLQSVEIKKAGPQLFIILSV